MIGLWGVLALSGCQTPPGIDAAGLADPEIKGPLASSELDRLGRQDIETGNNGLAEEHFRAATEKNRDDAFAWIGLAAAYDNLKRFDLADQAYEQAKRLKGESLSLMNNVGYSYYLRGDRARALVHLQRALGLYPGNPIVLNNIRLVRSGEQSNRRAAP